MIPFDKSTSTPYAKLEAVIRREKRTRLMTSLVTLLLLGAAALAMVSWLAGCAAGDAREQAEMDAVESAVQALNRSDGNEAAAFRSLHAGDAEDDALSQALDRIPGARFDIVAWAIDGDTMQSTLVVSASGEKKHSLEGLYRPGARYGMPNPDRAYTPAQVELAIYLFTIHQPDGRIVAWTSRWAAR